jgi:tetratricopeptide (TPR) repeat protein
LLHRGDPRGQILVRDATEMHHRVAAQPSAMVGPLRRLARGAERRGDWAAADDLFPRALVRQTCDLALMEDRITTINMLLRSKPGDVELLLRRATFYARLAQFDRAAAEFDAIVDLTPDAPDAWHRALPLLLQVKDFPRYRRRRHEALIRFETTVRGGAKHQIAKSALCFPIEGNDLAIAQKLADDALRLGEGDPFFLQQSKGMAEYRAGHFPEAIASLTKSCDHLFAERDILGDFYISMAWSKLGERQRARTAFELGNQLWEAFAPTPGADDMEHFEDWIFCGLARDEAAALLAAPGKP